MRLIIPAQRRLVNKPRLLQLSYYSRPVALRQHAFRPDIQVRVDPLSYNKHTVTFQSETAGPMTAGKCGVAACWFSFRLVACWRCLFWRGRWRQGQNQQPLSPMSAVVSHAIMPNVDRGWLWARYDIVGCGRCSSSGSRQAFLVRPNSMFAHSVLVCCSPRSIIQ